VRYISFVSNEHTAFDSHWYYYLEIPVNINVTLVSRVVDIFRNVDYYFPTKYWFISLLSVLSIKIICKHLLKKKNTTTNSSQVWNKWCCRYAIIRIALHNCYYKINLRAHYCLLTMVLQNRLNLQGFPNILQ